MSRRWVPLALALLVGCAQSSSVEVVIEQPAKTATTDFERLPSVLASIPTDGEVSLFEGLPSEFWEPELREQAIRKGQTVRFHGHPFYGEQLTLSGLDSEQITALFSARKSFRRYRQQKACGGYHPDYCVEWSSGGRATQALVSLECAEVMMFGPQGELYCDLGPEAEQRLKQLLGPYRKNRPATKADQ